MTPMHGSPVDILLVEDTASLAVLYDEWLSREGLTIERVAGGAAAIERLTRQRYRLILLDLQLPDMDGMAILQHVADQALPSAVIVVTAHGSIDRAVEAMRLGAYDFLSKPFDANRLLTTVLNALAHARLKVEMTRLRDAVGRDRFHGFVGGSLAMQGIYRMIETVAVSSAAVFITGESGTGKEVCAEAIHRAGPRAGGPFVPLNCAAIPRSLIETELFGHVKGAFTGAVADHQGAVFAADGGTLFLDEICEMDVALQTKLLRFVQTGRVQRVGSNRQEAVDVRIISATNRDPQYEIQEGRFREDLFYRLHVVPIHLPPLKERPDDILPIARYCLAQYAREENKRFEDFDAEAQATLTAHAWPGNVRELQNVIRTLVVLHPGGTVTARMLPTTLARPAPAPAPDSRADSGMHPMPSAAQQPIALGGTLAAIERDVIEGTITLCDGNITRAAEILDISPSTIYRKRQAWSPAGDPATPHDVADDPPARPANRR